MAWLSLTCLVLLQSDARSKAPVRSGSKDDDPCSPASRESENVKARPLVQHGTIVGRVTNRRDVVRTDLHDEQYIENPLGARRKRRCIRHTRALTRWRTARPVQRGSNESAPHRLKPEEPQSGYLVSGFLLVGLVPVIRTSAPRGDGVGAYQRSVPKYQVVASRSSQC